MFFLRYVYFHAPVTVPLLFEHQIGCIELFGGPPHPLLSLHIGPIIKGFLMFSPIPSEISPEEWSTLAGTEKISCSEDILWSADLL
jgi:hypothetical protein